MTSLKRKSPLRQPHRDRYDAANVILLLVFTTQPTNSRYQTGIGNASSLTHNQTVRYLDKLTYEGLLARVSIFCA
jgi:hypothetical protein